MKWAEVAERVFSRCSWVQILGEIYLLCCQSKHNNSCEIINNKNIQNLKMPDNEADSTTNQHHHILSLQTNASLIRVVNSKIYVPFISEKN